MGDQVKQMNVHNLAARLARGPLAVLVLLFCCAANTLGQTGKRELTVEWIFGPEGRSVASVPATAWLDDGVGLELRWFHDVKLDDSISGVQSRHLGRADC